MTVRNSGVVTRRALLGAFASSAVVAAPLYANAAGLLRGAGDIRRIRMHSARTGERVDTIYWIDGEYVGQSLAEITHFMRDWRNNKTLAIDSRTIDIMAALQNLLDASEPYLLLSGYRSPETNAMLRSSSSGVARNSRHLRGEAADLALQSRSVDQIYRAAQSISAGGVARYSSSGFVHIDCGPPRSWGT